MHHDRPQSSSGPEPPPHRYYLPSGRSSFAHHLPPPIPSHPSPRQRHFFPGPSAGVGIGSPIYRDPPSLGHTDPASWASDRPTSNRSSNRWSPTLPGLALSPSRQDGGDRHRDRGRERPGTSGMGMGMGTSTNQGQHAYNNQHHRLPPLADFSPRPGSGWGDSPSTGQSSASRPPTSYDYFRPSSSHQQPPPHPVASHQSFQLGLGPPPPHGQGHGPGPGPHGRVPTFERRLSDSGVYTPIAESPDPSSSQRAIESPQAGGAGEPGGKSKKKRRVALACAECSKRKQKCNRETPCQHCVSRRVPELCVPYTRNVSPPNSAGVGGATGTTTAGTAAKEGKAENEVKAEGPDVAGETVEAATAAGMSAGGSSKRTRAATLDRAQVQAQENGQRGLVPSASAPVTASTATAGISNRQPNVLPTLSVRVTRIEAIVNSIINKVDGLEGKALHDWRINHAPATTPPPREEPTMAPRAASLISSPRSRPHTGDTVMAREGSVAPEGLMTGIDEESSTRNPLPQSMIPTADPVPLILDYHGTPAEQLQRLFQDCGVSPHKVQELMAELPPRSDADDLIDWFFTKVNYIRYPISERLFRQSFDLLYENQTINSAAVLALPLVFIVLAMAIRVAPEGWVGGEDEKRTNSLRMYWNSRMAISMASAVKAENIQLVETRICTGLYLVLMHERRLAEGWAEFRAALTTGQAIGIHRDGAKLGLDPYSAEYRRRLWSYLLHADATYSCLLGRPISIDLRSCDTLPPSNIDLDQLESIAPSQILLEIKPLDQPTFATYLILRRALGEIVAKITQHFQRLDGDGEYRDIQALDDELTRLREGLPAAFRMTEPDRSWDEKCWYLPVHRYYIQTEILHFIIILHRPWLLRRLKSNRYQQSRQACFEAAVTDYKIRQAWKRDCPDFFETLLGSSFREFNASMIAGISMIIDPHGPHAADMRHIVSSFMEEHPHNPKADDFSQKEAAIIHTLHRRSQEMDERRALEQSSRVQISNERGQAVHMPANASAPPDPMSLHSRQASGSISPYLGTDSRMRENSDGSQYPRQHSHRSSVGSSVYDGTTPAKQATGGFGYGSGGPAAGGRPNLTPASSGSEDDQPQRLLDQWLVSNSSFGPGLDASSNPFMFSYANYPLAYQYNALPPQMSTQPLQAHLATSALGAMGNTGLYYGPGLTSTATAGSQAFLGSGLQPQNNTDTASSVMIPATHGTVPSLVGPMGDDGNPTVFWDRLIDGIVVGQGFDLVDVPV